MSTIRVGQRRRLKSTSFGLPREKKYVINTKRRAVAAVAYAKKNARNRIISPQERDRILKKVHKKFPNIQITPTSGFRM